MVMCVCCCVLIVGQEKQRRLVSKRSGPLIPRVFLSMSCIYICMYTYVDKYKYLVYNHMPKCINVLMIIGGRGAINLWSDTYIIIVNSVLVSLPHV